MSMKHLINRLEEDWMTKEADRQALLKQMKAEIDAGEYSFNGPDKYSFTNDDLEEIPVYGKSRPLSSLPLADLKRIHKQVKQYAKDSAREEKKNRR